MTVYDIEKLSDEELCGQLLCPDMCDMKEDEAIEYIKKNKPGALFLHSCSAEEIKKYTDIANSYSKYPVLVAADVEAGPVGKGVDRETILPDAMAWGACDDEDLIERAGELTAKLMRKRGVHFALAPVVDINLNKNNPLVNTRCLSDSAKQVAKIGSAYMRGMQKNGYLLSAVKHFPGDGVDDRNQHFCTSINSLSKEEWDNTFGAVYRKMIDDSVAAVMVAHVALPAYDKDHIDPVLGPMPGALSYTIMTDLLKGRLGFDGCIVSDAMSMIGSVSMVSSLDELAPRFVQSGGDMVLFPEKNDLDNLMKALKNGTLTRERVKDAVRRIIELKKKARLFEDQNAVSAEIDEEKTCEELKKLSEKIAEKSIKIERNVNKALPLKLKKGDKILLIDLYNDAMKKNENNNSGEVMSKDGSVTANMIVLENELKNRGFIVDVCHNISHYEINRIKDDYASIIVSLDISPRNWRGGELRLGWRDGIMIFWRGYLLSHKKLVVISFGDPYKLYELPFLKTYVNAFSNSKNTQKAVVKILLGEIEEKAKNPVALEGFFERETD